jgi:hypothetical protein
MSTSADGYVTALVPPCAMASINRLSRHCLPSDHTVVSTMTK